MIKGFNWGQMFHYTTLQFGKQKGIPDQLATTLKKEVPARLLENVRFSGTMSNYMNIHELAFGQHDNTITMWTQMSNQRHSLMQKLQFSANLLMKRREAIFSSFGQWIDQSYIYNMVETYQQLGCKTMAFTFNSHMPFVGHCTLDQSLESLKYVAKNTNLVSVELENETYYASYIVGGNSSSDHEPKIDKFIQYLEFSIVPRVLDIVGKNMPIGISVCETNVAKYRYWNRSVIALADRLMAKGVNVFLVPHNYTAGYSIADINFELDSKFNALPPRFRYRITEYNADSSAGNCSQSQAKEFIDRFNQIAALRPVDATYYHSLWTVRGAHFSYVK